MTQGSTKKLRNKKIAYTQRNDAMPNALPMLNYIVQNSHRYDECKPLSCFLTFPRLKQFGNVITSTIHFSIDAHGTSIGVHLSPFFRAEVIILDNDGKLNHNTYLLHNREGKRGLKLR